MKLPPRGSAEAHKLYVNLSRELEVSRNDRKSRAQSQRSAYLTGTEMGQRALYNKLMEYVTWSAANLHAPDGIRWGCAVPLTYGDKFIAWQEAAADHFATYYRDSGASLVFDLGVQWAHVYDGVVFKTIANSNDPQLWLIPDPSDLGVIREDQPVLSQQEALCHWYDLELPAFDRVVDAALLPTPEANDLKATAAQHAAPPKDSANLLPPAVSNLILSGASPSPISGAIPGFPGTVGSLARVTEPCAAMAEVWVKDDDAQAYRRVTIHTPTLKVIDDPIMKPTYGRHHCFHLLTLKDIPGYLWGLSPLEALIGLQVWREARMAEIDLREKLYLNPPLLFLGVSSIDDEVAGRFRAPGGNAYSSLPNADVKPIVPQMPADPMGLVKEIDQMFDRQAGMSRAGAGEGQPNVRGGDQEMALAALGSPRHRSTALRVEACESDIGTQMFRLMANAEDAAILDAEGKPFLLDQLADAGATMRVSGHSASPYYENMSWQRAMMLHKAGELDGDELVEFSGLARQDILRVKARRRMKAKAEQGQKMLEMKNKEVESKVLKAQKA